MKQLSYARHRGKCFQMWFPLIFPTTPTRRFYYCFSNFIGENWNRREKAIYLPKNQARAVEVEFELLPHSSQSSICIEKWLLRPWMSQTFSLLKGHPWSQDPLFTPNRGASSMQGIPSFSSSLTCLLSFLGSVYDWFWPQLRQSCKEKHRSFPHPHFYPWCLVPSHEPFHWTMDYLSWNLIFSHSFVTRDPK